MRILALDPGERTGWAAGTWDGEELTDVTQGVAALKDMALALEKNIHKYDVVVYETWRLYPHMAKKLVGNDMQPSQMVGMIRLLSWLHPSVKLKSFGADVKNTALKTIPQSLKRRLARCSEEHDKDALLLLWHYCWKDSHGSKQTRTAP